MASALALLCLTAMYELFVPGMRAWTVSNRRSHLRQAVLVTMSRVSHDLKSTCVESVVIAPGTARYADAPQDEDSDRVTFAWARDDQGHFRRRPLDGAPDWQQYEVIYHDPRLQEVRIAYRTPFRYDPVTGALCRLEAFSGVRSREHVLARGIRGFSVRGRPRGNTPAGTRETAILRANPFSIRVHGRDEDEDCTLQTAVSALMVVNPSMAETSD